MEGHTVEVRDVITVAHLGPSPNIHPTQRKKVQRVYFWAVVRMGFPKKSTRLSVPVLTHSAGGRAVHAGLVAEDAATFVHLRTGIINIVFVRRKHRQKKEQNRNRERWGQRRRKKKASPLSSNSAAARERGKNGREERESIPNRQQRKKKVSVDRNNSPSAPPSR